MSAPMPRPAPVMSQTFLSLMSVPVFLVDVAARRVMGGGTAYRTSRRGQVADSDERGTDRDPQPRASPRTVEDMAGSSDAGDIRGDVRGQIGAFLSTRRARITPVQA